LKTRAGIVVVFQNDALAHFDNTENTGVIQARIGDGGRLVSLRGIGEGLLNKGQKAEQ
jgi:hypothetical protein